MKRTVVALITCFGLMSGVAQAAIDFESDGSGSKANGFSSVVDAGVHFSDTVGAGLIVGDYGVQSIGKSLHVSDDSDGSKLRISFDFVVSALSLMFGNDDPGWTGPSDRAWLEVFSNGVSLARVGMEMNRDDQMNQTMSFSGLNFDSAEFWYGDSLGSAFTTGSSRGLIEIVDNIEYRAGQQVPEPVSLALFGIGLVGLGMSRRRRV